ncbi:hypothetical protein [Leifsonia sp. 563]|uniref:hypothetical protein n=1 Tax=Leifsonia sp. 563 TaxID=3156412 RepID=UPI0033984D12
MNGGVLGLLIVSGFVAVALIITLVVNKRVMRQDRARRCALGVQGQAIVLTGIYGSQTNFVLKRIARAENRAFTPTGLRFTVIVDSDAMTWWRGAEDPLLIARFPLQSIRDVGSGTTSFGNSTFPTIFFGVAVNGRTFDLQLRVANAKGVWNATAMERDRFASAIRERVEATRLE